MKSVRSPFLQGALDTLPMILAAIPFGILFGVLGPANDVSLWLTLALSAFVFAGSAQYVAIGLIASGTPALIVVMTTFVVNLRHLLYALAMLQPFQHLKRKEKIPLSFFLTDETFVTFNQRYQVELAEKDRKAYYLGSALFMYGNWQLCTWLGLWAGQSFTGIEKLGLEFAMVTAFIAMMLPMFQHKKNIVSAILGFTCAWFTRDWPHKTGIVFSVLVAATLAAQLKFLEPKND